MEKINRLERENDFILRKRREEFLVQHINETLDQRFLQFNDNNMRPWIQNGAPVLLKPVHMDDNELLADFLMAENDYELENQPRKDKKKKKKKKSKKKAVS